MTINTNDLKKFAQSARRQLREQVAARLEQVLKTDSAALREREAARKELSQQIAETSKKTVIDRVAYTWFNRFCALRFMDVNRYNRIGVVSPAEGFTQPEILQEAKQGYIDSDLQAFVDCPAVFDLLGGRRPSTDPQQEAYRLLLVGTCNALNKVMPFLFEPIADYTELLMPQDLLSEHSILNDLREAMTPEACQDVEVIGWLYQFYISERKDEVFEALKKNQKIEAEDIPAATQLFTPHWIVRYLVENSLGRLWMLNHPTSRLVEEMDYYIKPEEPETDFLRIASPEEIKVCDPACGSGHMLTYAFDLLYAIYEEEGYPAANIPRLILEKNLYGIEIDERAGDLAAFALVMKARGRDRRFFNRDVQPNICVLENITFTDQELKEYAGAMGRDLFTEPLLQTLKQFEQAKNFGSLIRPVLTDGSFVIAELERKGLVGNIFLYGVQERILKILKQSELLGQRYHIVLANPPYMSARKGMNSELKDFLYDYYEVGKEDLFSAFSVMMTKIILNGGYLGIMSPVSWMFLSSFEDFRKTILSHHTITNLVRPEYHAFFDSAYVSICAFVLLTKAHDNIKGGFIDLNKFYGAELQPQKTLEAIRDPNCPWFHMASTADFKKMPGWAIAYWVSDNLREIFLKNPPLRNVATPRQGLATSDNDRFLRFWYEVNYGKIGFDCKSRGDALSTKLKWFPTLKGGDFRKWYGNNEHVINWENDGEEVLGFAAELYGSPTRTIKNMNYYFKRGVTWSLITSSKPSFRYFDFGYIFNVAAPSVFSNDDEILLNVLALLNSKIVSTLLPLLNPTVNSNTGDLEKIPFVSINMEKYRAEIIRCIQLGKNDWNISELSWDFSIPPIMETEYHSDRLKDRYAELRIVWDKTVYEMRNLEQENNKAFLDAYGLQTELTPDVPLEEITLTCNPYFRYGGNRSEAELEALLLADTMREFISYAVGCMFGRYSLDKPGLILANQGENLQDYLRQVPDPTFLPDEDNAIPVLEGEWFSDDITERFKKFLRVTFGEQHYEENLAFIENAIGRDIRSYFLKEFYSQHVKMYQKRPIYWMFSSPKGSFNVLIYMHRYQPDTLSVILNRYLREFRGKLEGRKAHLEQVSISASSTQREKTSALKEIEGLNKTLEEIRVYERDILYPLAVQGIQIDLDDGVKVNYKKFGKALAKVNGLSD